MKKRLLIAIALVISLILPFTYITYNRNKDYKYADSRKITRIDKSYSKIQSLNFLYEYTTDCDIDLAEYKEAILRHLNNYNINWENFNKTTTTKQLVISNPAEEFIKQLAFYNAIELLELIESSIALYDDSNNCILLMPIFNLIEDQNKRFCVFLHELSHPLLTPANQITDDYICPLEEGAADYLAKVVAESLDIDFVSGYQNECLAIEWLMAIYGENEIIQVVRNNMLDELIDSGTKNGMSAKLNYALESMREKDYKSIYSNIVLDILIHLAKNANKESEVSTLYKEAVASFKNPDIKYFNKLLYE
ncbi:hypothetical protein J6S37_02070 [Candidatus Saccharibacteria bacterium]|nr:hypothetical protein [Candidatus Saccharibacteria bacterium]